MTDRLRSVPDPEGDWPDEYAPTERGRALIQGARWRLQSAPEYVGPKAARLDDEAAP